MAAPAAGSPAPPARPIACVKAREGFFGKFATVSEMIGCKLQNSEFQGRAVALPPLCMDSSTADAKLSA
jgi:hypothetical protein